MAEEISESLALRRFDSYAFGRCECCGKELIRSRRGREGDKAWEAHHMYPDLSTVSLNAIRVVCSTGRNCHLNCCHNGNYLIHPEWRPCNQNR